MSRYSSITNNKRNQFKSAMDEFCTFNWCGVDSWDEFGAFIIADKRGDLKAYNGPTFTNNYAKPQFESGTSQLQGITFNTQQIDFKIGVYWISMQEYRRLLDWLHPYELNDLGFNYNPNYAYFCKLSKIDKADKYIIGYEDAEPMYYFEMNIAFEIQGEFCAHSKESYPWKENKNLINLTDIKFESKEITQILDGISYDFIAGNNSSAFISKNLNYQISNTLNLKSELDTDFVFNLSIPKTLSFTTKQDIQCKTEKIYQNLPDNLIFNAKSENVTIYHYNWIAPTQIEDNLTNLTSKFAKTILFVTNGTFVSIPSENNLKSFANQRKYNCIYFNMKNGKIDNMYYAWLNDSKVQYAYEYPIGYSIWSLTKDLVFGWLYYNNSPLDFSKDEIFKNEVGVSENIFFTSLNIEHSFSYSVYDWQLNIDFSNIDKSFVIDDVTPFYLYNKEKDFETAYLESKKFIAIRFEEDTKNVFIQSDDGEEVQIYSNGALILNETRSLILDSLTNIPKIDLGSFTYNTEQEVEIQSEILSICAKIIYDGEDKISENLFTIKFKPNTIISSDCPLCFNYNSKQGVIYWGANDTLIPVNYLFLHNNRKIIDFLEVNKIQIPGYLSKPIYYDKLKIEVECVFKESSNRYTIINEVSSYITNKSKNIPLSDDVCLSIGSQNLYELTASDCDKFDIISWNGQITMYSKIKMI